MTHEPARRLTVPSGYEYWWSVELQPWWRDIDYLGHVTAAVYGTIYEEAMARFLSERWETGDADYVVAHLAMTYVREVRMSETPVRVFVRCEEARRSTFVSSLVIAGSDGAPRNVAHAEHAAWDRQLRRSRPLTPKERNGLLGTTSTTVAE
ncbi:acyl-CoA thioesterase [Streptomyces spongiae]|uniref:acyl-CoA thioesterase n=1 Tax=Streptomyces spongiae TaxID=565072 RepID=UPI002AD4E353|nr:acyl-CoA thioesterase [Streptomyces spongiae]